MPDINKDCDGSKVGTRMIARRLENSAFLFANLQLFLDNLAPNSANLKEFDGRRKEREQPIYLLYDKALEVWVQTDSPGWKTVSELDALLRTRSLDLHGVADDLLQQQSDYHVCKNCKIVASPLSRLSFRYPKTVDFVKSWIFLGIGLGILIVLGIIAWFLVPVLHNQGKTETKPEQFRTLPNLMTLPKIDDTTVTTTPKEPLCIHPTFTFGPYSELGTLSEGGTLTQSLESYSDLKPEPTCCPVPSDLRPEVVCKLKALEFSNYTCDPNLAKVHFHCPSYVVSLLIGGGILREQLEQLLEAMQEIELDKIDPIKVTNTNIGFLTLLDMPSMKDCGHGVHYLAPLINRVAATGGFRWVEKAAVGSGFDRDYYIRKDVD